MTSTDRGNRHWLLSVVIIITVFAMTITNFAPSALAQNPRSVFFYDDQTGDAATGRVDVDGSFVTLQSYSDLYTGWTNITAVNTEIALFYSRYSGRGATARLDAAGNLTWLQTYNTFSFGWTHIVAVGGQRLLFYNATTGGLATGQIDGAGNFLTLRTGNISPGFYDITKTTDDLLLFYKTNPLTYYTAYVDDSGSLHGVHTDATATQGSNWRVLGVGFNVVVNWNGVDQLYTSRMKLDGTIKWMQRHYDPGWTQIAAASNGMFLLYDGRTGRAEIDLIRSDQGEVVAARTYDNFNTHWTLIAAW